MARRGWGWVAALAVALAAGAAVVSSRGADAVRGPAAIPNPLARPPAIDVSGGVTRVRTEHPAALLVVDTAPPTGSVRLLWFRGQGTAWTPEGAIALDASAAPIRFDERLRADRLRLRLGGRAPTSLAPARDGTLWVATREGSLLHLDAGGAIADTAVPPFEYSHIAADRDGRIWAVRSPNQFVYPFRFDPEPLVAPVDGADSLPVTARRPFNPLFLHLVNAGRIAFPPGGGVVFAPFIRDEIVRLAPTGDTVWVASRGLRHGVDEPAFRRDSAGRPLLDYAPVNVGLAMGPDDMLYVLSTPDTSTIVARLDVIDPETGIVRRTGLLPTALPTLAVDEAGRAYLLDAFRLLTGVAPAERDPLPPFDVERLGGGRLTLDAFAGRVVLVNFWASWCHPCRDEMPALDTLADAFAADPFAFVALSDDVEPRRAAAFIEEFGFAFPVGLGRGRLRERYHYVGLPFTVLVDAQGRVIQRWEGFGGASQLDAIRHDILAELDRMSDMGSGAAHGHHAMP